MNHPYRHQSHLALTLDSRALSPYSGKACGRPLLRVPPWHRPPIPCNGISRRHRGLPSAAASSSGIWHTPPPTRLESVPPSHSAVSTCLRPIDAIEQRIVQLHSPSIDPVSWQLHTESARHPVPREAFWTGRLVSPLPTQSSSCRAFSLAEASCSALLWACRSFTRLESLPPLELAHTWFFRRLMSTTAVSVKP